MEESPQSSNRTKTEEDAMAKYYVQADTYSQVHAFKVSRKGALHLNVTHFHFNKLNYDWRPTPDMIEISENEFNSYKRTVLNHLDSI